jgi:type I restriction enzyme M protein
MLDVETKNRINTARDILVGKVPDPKSQVEQITIALIYKFMDDMDVESEELGGKRTFFTGDFAKYAWRRIFDPRQGGYELLNLYSEAIGKMDTNPGVPKLFRDIFKNAYLPYRDPETLKSFLKIINEFDYSHSEKLGDAFEFLLSILGSQGDAGQFRTPRHIIDFMVELIDPKKHEIILDPACGTAGFLISSYKHIIRQNSSNYPGTSGNGENGVEEQTVNERIISTNGYTGDKLSADDRKHLAGNIHGYDISPDMVRLSLVNMYLHGIQEPKISEYDTLTSEDNWNQYCDVILANPPFMSPKGGIRPHKRFSVQSNRSEVLFVDFIAEHLTRDGRAAVIVPEGIIFQSGNAYKQLRKMLVEKYLVGVISLPAGVFQPYSGVKTSILWIDKVLAKKTDKILFVKIENDGFDLGAQRKSIKDNDLPNAIRRILQYKFELDVENYEGITEFLLVSKERILSNVDYVLTSTRYSQSRLTENSAFLSMTLGDCCDIYNGSTPSRQEKRYWSNGNIPWFTIDDIRDSGRIISKTKQHITNDALRETSVKLLPINAVLLCCTASVGEYAFTEIEVTTNQQFNGLVVNAEYKSKLLPKYLFSISPMFKEELIRLSGKTSFNFVSVRTLREVKIPVPPLYVQNEIVSELESYQKIIDGARMVVENYKPRIEINPEWEVVQLDEVCKEVTDGSHFSPITSDSGYPYITVRDLCDGKIDFINSKKVSENDYQSLVKSGCRPHQNDVLFSKDGTVGKTALVKTDDDFVVLSSLAILTPDAKLILPEFLYYIVSTDWFISKAIDNKTGVAIKRIVLKTLKTITIPLPKLIIQEKIVRVLNNERQIIDSNRSLIQIFEQKIKDRIAKVWGE